MASICSFVLSGDLSACTAAEGGRLKVTLGGLQVHAVAINTKFSLDMLVATASNRPPYHLYISHSFLHSFPPLVSALVASSLCLSFLLGHVALECPGLHMYPWDQQYPIGSNTSSLLAVSAALVLLFAVFPGVVGVVVTPALTFTVRAATSATSGLFASIIWVILVWSPSPVFAVAAFAEFFVADFVAVAVAVLAKLSKNLSNFSYVSALAFVAA